MKRNSTSIPSSRHIGPFALLQEEEATQKRDSLIHTFRNGFICETDTRGYSTPQGRSPAELVVTASEGFIPLWAKNTTLRWRFGERSMRSFENSDHAKGEIRELFGEALLKWGNAAPVKFTEKEDVWDFKLVVRETDNCTTSGCVLASAFFPDPGRHELIIYPKLFSQSRKEQVDTLIHEIGHIFGLRHFFADIRETQWRSEVFGTHSPFSIMNYGDYSELTDNDQSDLRQLYQLAWSGQLTQINGTPIRFVNPYHTLGSSA